MTSGMTGNRIEMQSKKMPHLLPEYYAVNAVDYVIYVLLMPAFSWHAL